DALALLYQWTRQDFPYLLPPRHLVPVVLFSADDALPAFWDRAHVAYGLPREALGAGVDAFTIGASAASIVGSPRSPRLARWVNVASRALLRGVFGSLRHSWLLEGIGTHYEWRLLPPTSRTVGAAITDPMPLDTLLNGECLPPNPSARAALVLEW